MKKSLFLPILAYGLLSSATAYAAEGLKITNIRIGQGDATLIQGPVKPDGSRVNVLFDAGQTRGFKSGSAIRVVLEKNGVGPKKQRDGTLDPQAPLDFLIVSHDDFDHMGGAVAGGNHGNSFILGHDDSVGCAGDDDGDNNVDWEVVDVEYIAGRKKDTTERKTRFYKPDADELGGCDDMQVTNIVDYGISNFRMDAEAHYKYKFLVDALVSRGTNKVDLDTGSKIGSYEIDLGGGAKMVCYAGNGFVRGHEDRFEKAKDPNELSLSFLVSYADFDFLISGDLIGRHGTEVDESGNVIVKRSPATDAHLEVLVGEQIKNAGRKVEVLHVDHHGADNGSAEAFLEHINPDVAIISSGNGNKYLHPTNGTLQRLHDAGVYRIIQTSWGNPEDRVSEPVRNRQAIYQSDVVINVNLDFEDPTKAFYYISTGRWFRADRDYTPE